MSQDCRLNPKVEELSKAKAELQRLSVYPDTRYEFFIRERTLKDMNSALSNREKKGFAQGLAKAESKVKKAESRAREAESRAREAELNTKLENAKNLLKVLDDETIAQSIGLKVSQVAKLRDES